MLRTSQPSDNHVFYTNLISTDSQRCCCTKVAKVRILRPRGPKGHPRSHQTTPQSPPGIPTSGLFHPQPVPTAASLLSQFKGK